MPETTQIVFIHGMYMNGHSWRPWVDRATSQGFECFAPSWPHHDGEPTALRSRIDPALGSLTFGGITAHLKAFIDALPARPILIGHSIGGLVVQKLINDGYGAAGVAICPAPPAGVFTASPTFVRANFPHVNPLAGSRPVVMTPKRFHYTFANTMTRAASDDGFIRYAVPESRNVPRTTLTSQGRIDFATPHAPLLVIAADQDHLTPLALIRRNVAAYRRDAGTVDFITYAGRSHFICNQPGWEEVADASFAWVRAH